MPCRDDGYPTAADEAKKELETLLCEACSLLEEHKLLIEAGQELNEWFTQHEECEQNRVRYEAALKLSVRERRLLGINLQELQNKMQIEKNRRNYDGKGLINRR